MLGKNDQTWKVILIQDTLIQSTNLHLGAFENPVKYDFHERNMFHCEECWCIIRPNLIPT